MHNPPPLVLPEPSNVLSTRNVWRPASSIALSGIPLFNHVSVKIRTLQFKSLLLYVMLSRISSILFNSDRTLARKMLGKESRCGVSFSLALSPPRFPRLCLRSRRRLRALPPGRAECIASGDLAISGRSRRLSIKLSEIRKPISKSSPWVYDVKAQLFWTNRPEMSKKNTAKLQNLERPRASRCTRAAILDLQIL